MIDRPTLEAQGVSKRFGDRQALCDVDLVAQPSQIHGLIGPNGAGKTTLMRVCLGLIRPDSGSVRIMDHALRSTAGPIPSGAAGFIESPGFYPYLSARRNLALLARLDDATTLGRPMDIDALLDQVGLIMHANVAVGAFSAGMRQRLGLAAALLRRPRLLLLDEPTNSLDPAGARDIRAVVRGLASDGTAVVWSSHDLAEVEELCSILTVVNQGQTVFSGTVEDLQARSPASAYVMCTSDDGAALVVASDCPLVHVASAPTGGLDVVAETGDMDAYVLALARTGIAIRLLTARTRSLESLFFDLTRPPRSAPPRWQSARDTSCEAPARLAAS